MNGSFVILDRVEIHRVSVFRFCFLFSVGVDLGFEGGSANLKFCCGIECFWYFEFSFEEELSRRSYCRGIGVRVFGGGKRQIENWLGVKLLDWDGELRCDVF